MPTDPIKPAVSAMTPLEIAEFYVGSEDRPFPESELIIKVNAEDYATIVAEIDRLTADNAALKAKLAERDQELLRYREAVANAVERSTVPQGYTIVDFLSVWLGQEEDMRKGKEAEVAALREAVAVLRAAVQLASNFDFLNRMEALNPVTAESNARKVLAKLTAALASTARFSEEPTKC